MADANEILKAAKEFLEDIPDDVPTMGLLSLLYGNENMNSDIISCLLDEKGSHKQGRTFLDLFIKQVFKKTDSDFNDFKSTKREDHTKENRRIDIVIEFEKSIIGIECKTNDYTIEQDKQLEDYYKELCKRNKENVYLIYLTPFGKSSTTLEEADKKELNERYKEISWSKDIIDWLNECIKCIDKCEDCENLKAEIYLYIEYIKKLTYQDTRGKIMIENMFEKLVECDIDDLQKLQEYQDTLNRFHIKTFQVIKALKDKKLDIVYWDWSVNPAKKLANENAFKDSLLKGVVWFIVSIKGEDNTYYGYSNYYDMFTIVNEDGIVENHNKKFNNKTPNIIAEKLINLSNNTQ